MTTPAKLAPSDRIPSTVSPWGPSGPWTLPSSSPYSRSIPPSFTRTCAVPPARTQEPGNMHSNRTGRCRGVRKRSETPSTKRVSLRYGAGENARVVPGQIGKTTSSYRPSSPPSRGSKLSWLWLSSTSRSSSPPCPSTASCGGSSSGGCTSGGSASPPGVRHAGRSLCHSVAPSSHSSVSSWTLWRFTKVDSSSLLLSSISSFLSPRGGSSLSPVGHRNAASFDFRACRTP
mmetsp:Transcript_9646/g.22554  ORF Transcript_9646/g.22554 Transcript_9646/m.22554 type:complete len:231 (+) Transcript_9646:709-1401(+)